MEDDRTEESSREAPGRESSGRASREPGSKRRLRAVKLVLAVALALIVLVIVFQNQEPVRTRFLLWQMEMPRFFLLAVVYLLGIVTGWIAFWRTRRPGG